MAQDLFSSSTRICFRHAIDPEPVVDALVCGGDNLEWNALLYQGASLAPNYQCILINSIGEGVAESDETTSLNFDVDTTANYYIHAYDGTCALSWGPKLITVPWMDLGEDIYVCDDENYQITPGQVSAELASAQDVNFDWIDNQSLTWGGPYPIITPDADPNPNTYSVTVTYTNSISLGCSLSDAFQIYRVECCDGNEVTLHNPDLEMLNDAINDVDPTTNGTIVISNETININGKLFINNHNLRLENCTLNMAEGSEIVVDRHLVLGLDGTLIQACGEKMWKGIRLLESATINNNGDPSEISDAEYAVTTRYRSRLVLDNFDENAVSFDPYLIFKRNYISLFVPPSPTGALNDVELKLANLDFDADGVLNDPYLGQTTPVITGSKSFAGMVFNDVAGVIGIDMDIDFRINLANLNNGIIAYNSSLLINNSTFADIQAYNPGPGFNGSAIFVHGDNSGLYSLIQEGLGKTNTNATFTNCKYGILGYGTTMKIKENKMTNVETGIAMINNSYRTNVISNNDISCTRIGITSAFNDHAFTLINFNEITLNPGGGNNYTAGINIAENGFSTQPKQLFIYGNDPITVTTGLNAIALNSTQNSQVHHNTISLAGNSNTVSGIRMNTCREANVHDNEITGSGATGNDQRAFNVYSTILTELRRNFMDNTEIGMHYDEPCNDTWMTCNEMKNHNFGGKVDAGGLFGHLHFLSLNTWTGSNTPAWGFQFIPSPGIDPNDNLFFYNSNDANTEPPTYNPFDFFQTTPDEATDDCEDDPGPIETRPAFNDFDYEIAANNFERENFEDEYNYIVKSNLYYKASLFPDSIIPESAIDSFYNANQTTSIGLFRELEKQAAIFFKLDSTALATISFNDSLVDHFLNAIALNDSILSDSIPESDSLNIVEENDIYKSLLYSIVNSSRQLMTGLDTLHSFYSDSILSLNSAIGVSNTIEANQKSINEIFYSTISRGILNFDSAQAATIFDIAIQCPESGGKAVPVAQSIYRLIVDTITFENDTNCGGGSPRFAKIENTKANKSYVYPNPASNSATLKFSLPDKQNGWFIIFDFLSRELERFPLDTETHEFEFNTAILNSGIYYYRIISEGKVESSGKFTIVK